MADVPSMVHNWLTQDPVGRVVANHTDYWNTPRYNYHASTAAQQGDTSPNPTQGPGIPPGGGSPLLGGSAGVPAMGQIGQGPGAPLGAGAQAGASPLTTPTSQPGALPGGGPQGTAPSGGRGEVEDGQPEDHPGQPDQPG